MKKRITVTITTLLLILISLLAIIQQPKSYYPLLEFEATDPSGALVLSFLLNSTSSLERCEATLGNIARETLTSCPLCRAKLMKCLETLDRNHVAQLSEQPLANPSGRMAGGIVLFESVNQELARTSCEDSEKVATSRDVAFKCFAAGKVRSALSTKKPAYLGIGAILLIVSAFLASCFTVWLILRYEHLHSHLSHDHIDAGPQKYHEFPTPRIGGLAIMAGLFTALAIINLNTAVPAISVLFPGISSHSSVLNLGFLLLAAMPAFLGGLFEDITKKVGVLERLLLTMLSGCIGAWLLGAVLPRLDIPGIDAAFAWFPFAVVFTLFAVGGIANSINIIDGYNGLAGGFSIIVLIGLAFVGHQTGDALIACLALGLAGSILGFLVWNWPAGKIFLGDGGAYLIGFMLAELSVLLVVRNPEVSPWFPLALLAYPVFETIYSIYRRRFVNDASPGQADNQHLHQLIHDYLVPNESKNGDPICRLECNSRVAKYLWAPASVMALLASVFWSSTPMLVACVLSYCVFYIFNYRRIFKSQFQLQKPSV
jgi:UDP-N-acetylmuramyl pentapeptide phosphotransferase/UDP-N-acetylglucosamine-1-phosphate transferase